MPYAHIPATTDTPPVPLLKCPRCGHLWKAKPPRAPLNLAGVVTARGFSIQHAALVLKELPEHMVHASVLRVLDVGCWDGAVLSDFPSTWIRHGIEPHPQAAQLARARGLHIFEASLESAPLAANTYDVIVLLDVLEHLEDPMAALRQVSKALAPGGYLVALTGNAASFAARFYKGCWYYSNYSEHITFFTPVSLHRAVNEVGLTSIRMESRRHHSATLYVTIKRLIRRVGSRPTNGEDALPLPTSILDLIKLAASRIFRGRDHLLLLAHKPSL